MDLLRLDVYLLRTKTSSNSIPRSGGIFFGHKLSRHSFEIAAPLAVTTCTQELDSCRSFVMFFPRAERGAQPSPEFGSVMPEGQPQHAAVTVVR